MCNVYKSYKIYGKCSVNSTPPLPKCICIWPERCGRGRAAEALEEEVMTSGSHCLATTWAVGGRKVRKLSGWQCGL